MKPSLRTRSPRWLLASTVFLSLAASACSSETGGSSTSTGAASLRTSTTSAASGAGTAKGTGAPTTSASGTTTGTAAPAVSPNATATVPFKLEVVEVPGSTLPALHSFASATADGKWLVIGGRIGGLHGFDSGTNNFPRSAANTTVYALDLANNKVLGSADVTKLPKGLAGPLTSSNPEFVQVGNDLTIIGGYGKDLTATTEKMTTFGSIIQIDVKGLIGALEKKGDIAAYFKQNKSPDNRLKVTGGALKQFGGTFYLVFGQDFSGDYSVNARDYNKAGGQFQKYTQKVRVFNLKADLSLDKFTQIDAGYDDSLPYNRRDLNVVDTILPDGKTPGATVYGGVFKAGQVAGHTVPIDLVFPSAATAPATMAMGAGFKQGLSHYDCAYLTVFDDKSSSSYTTLLGGISQYHYDQAANTLVLDQLDLAHGVDGLPFIDTISTLRRGPGASGVGGAAFAQFIQPAPLPALLGSESQFLHDPALKSAGKVFDNGVIKLAELEERTLVGHMYGGIESAAAYSALVKTPPSTKASARLFQIYVTPGASPVIPLPALPTQATPYPLPPP